MKRSKAHLARGLLHMEQLVRAQMKELPDPPLDRDFCFLPTIVSTENEDDAPLQVAIRKVSAPSARGMYLQFLGGIEGQLNELSDSV